MVTLYSIINLAAAAGPIAAGKSLSKYFTYLVKSMNILRGLHAF